MNTKRMIAVALMLTVFASACSQTAETTEDTSASPGESVAVDSASDSASAAVPATATEAAPTEAAPTEEVAQPEEATPTEDVAPTEDGTEAAPTEDGTDGADDFYVEGDGDSLADQISLVECTDPGIEAELAEPELRTALRGLIQDHVTRTAVLVQTAGETGLDSSETMAANTSLDVNGLQLGDAVGMVYGDGAADAFVAIWRRHLQLFTDYAVGVATEDVAAQDAADAGLRAYSEDFAAFFHAATEERMPIDPTIETFDGHIDTVEALIRDTLSGTATEVDPDDAAHNHVIELSDMITNAVQGQFPCRFPIAEDAGNAKPQVAQVDPVWATLVAQAVAINCDLTPALI